MGWPIKRLDPILTEQRLQETFRCRIFTDKTFGIIEQFSPVFPS